MTAQKRLESMTVQEDIARKQAPVDIARAEGSAKSNNIIQQSLTREYLQHEANEVMAKLVGVALALFYLLLISLSEHLEFVLSYAIAAVSCVALLGFYVRYILASKARAFSFSVLLSVLYGLLYVLL